ncbi:MAG: lipopolysaccharide biosynthesis protein [Planctomycetota bacterium]
MNFRRWVVFTFLIHALVVVIDKGGGLVLYALTANQPAQHGGAGIVAALPFVLSAIANLGLATALVWFVRRQRYSAQTCFETAMAVALGWGAVVGVAAWCVVMYALPMFDPEWLVDPWLVLPVCLAVPLLLVASYANSTQLATERIRDYGIVHLVTSLAFLPAFFAVFLAIGGDVGAGDVKAGVAWGRMASTAVVAVVALWLVRKVVQLRVRVHRQFLGDALRFGWKANLTSTLAQLNQRLDMIVLGVLMFRTLRADGIEVAAATSAANVQVAFYSMAITWAELVWHFPEALRDLFFSKVAGSTDEEARVRTPVLARLGLAASVVAAAALLLLVDPVMGLVTLATRGSTDVWLADWSEPVGACLLALAPGTVAFTVSKVLQADLGARDRLDTCIAAQSTVFVTMLALDALWIPSHGALGAAWASSVAYFVGTVVTVVAYARQTGTPMWRCLVVQRADLRYIAEVFAAVVAKMRRRTA